MTPNEVLVKYITAMNVWEAECARLYRERVAGKIEFSEAMRIGMDAYRPIFENYCSLGRAKPRESLSFSTPSEYDPETEKIATVVTPSAGSAEIETQHTTHRRRILYRLVLEDGEWRLLEKFFITEDGEVIRSEL